jgi:nucleoside 2-deoxyribosyltransferase
MKPLLLVKRIDIVRTKLYLAGPIFNEAEIEWARRIKRAIEDELGNWVEVIWPHELSSGSGREIFKTNLSALQECPLMLAILEGSHVDDGTAWEMGYHYAREGLTIAIRTDFRKAGETDSSKVNLMVENSCHVIVHSLDELIMALKKVLTSEMKLADL